MKEEDEQELAAKGAEDRELTAGLGNLEDLGESHLGERAADSLIG